MAVLSHQVSSHPGLLLANHVTRFAAGACSSVLCGPRDQHAPLGPGQYPRTLTGFLPPLLICSHASSVSSASWIVSSSSQGATISESDISVNIGFKGT
ncbi:hypothetical protein V6N13_114703 [Hibiscus sabdariffa]|uniref:Uncharacterized protein n=1 Tax=Hibiscus sabdariffa TaxID=183260 RepID=A0ABR2U368_9ROSI